MVNFDINSDKSNKRIGLLTSIIIHSLLLLFVLFSPPLIRELPPPGYEGIMVRFGDNEERTVETEETESEESQNEQTNNENNTEEQTKPTKEIPVNNPVVPTVTSEKEKITIKNQKTKNTADQVANKEQASKAKDDFSKLFKTKGKKSSSGNQGDPLGSRDSDILEGITKGKGKVGDGLDSRGVMYEPAFEDSSQKSGVVVVRLCIDQSGKVISSKYTQRGSTTTDTELINIAVSNAKKYRFNPSSLPEQCGTVSITFIVR